MALPLVTPGLAGQFGLAGAGLLPAGPDIGALAAPPFSTANALAGPSLDLQLAGLGVLDSRMVFTRASSATDFTSAGALQTLGTNVARFDFNPATLAALGLENEESRTNLLLNSATLGTQTVTVTATATTLSFYGTGTVVLSGAFSGTLVGSGAFPTRSVLTFTPTAGSLTCTVTATVSNAQVEAGANATSWIPTTGAAATRAADLATMPLGSWFNPAAGTLVVETMFATPQAFYPELCAISDGTNNNYIGLFYDTPFNRYEGALVAAGVGSFDSFSGSTAALIVGAIAKTGVTWGGGSATFQANPGTGPTGAYTASATIPAGLTTLVIGAAPNLVNVGTRYNRRVRCWPRQLTAGELQAALT